MRRTLSGGVITLVSSLIMFCLFVSEFSALPPTPATVRSCTPGPWVFSDWMLAGRQCSRSVVCLAGIFLMLNTANELSVDTSRGEKLEINVRLLHSCTSSHVCACESKTHTAAVRCLVAAEQHLAGRVVMAPAHVS